MSAGIWMEHRDHGGRAFLPDIPYWRGAGWEPCDGPPPEPDLTRDPPPEPEPEPPAKSATKTPKTSSGSSAVQPVTADSAEEPEENDRG